MGDIAQVSRPKTSLLWAGYLHCWLAPDVASSKLPQEAANLIPLPGPSSAAKAVEDKSCILEVPCGETPPQPGGLSCFF